MRKVHLLGFALVAMLAFNAFAAVSVSAETTLLAEWLVSGSGVVTLTSVETNASLTLEDNATIFGADSALCPGEGEAYLDGSVGPNGEDEITEMLTPGGVAVGTDVGGTLTGSGMKCLGVKVCAPEADAEVFVANLPWHTLLFLMENGMMLDRIFGAGAGKEPGWELVCLIGGVPTTDLCEGPTSMTMENMVSEYDLLGNFDTTSAHLSCSLGNATSGVFNGATLTSTLDGSVITVSSEEEVPSEVTLLAEWLINGSGVVTLTSVETVGSLELTDTGTGSSALCPNEGESTFDGSVGPNGEDEITEVLTPAGAVVGKDNGGALEGTGMKCLGVTICAKESDAEVFFANLPWHTLLFSMESGTMLDRIFGSGAGKEPGYEVVCLIGGVAITDLCEGPTSMTMENMLSGGGTENDLLGNFDATSEHTSCSLGDTTSGVLAGATLTSTLDSSVITVSGEEELPVNALLAEWLINGVGVPTLTSVETKGVASFEDTGTIFGSAGFRCPDAGEFSFDGTVGPNGEDEITEVLTPGGVAVGKDNGGTLQYTGMKCTGVKVCAAENDAEIYIANLPWHTLLFLAENGAMLDRIFGSGAGKEPGFEVVCLIGGLSTTDLCEGLTSMTMENMLSVSGTENDLLGNFDATSEHISCALGNATSGLLIGEMLISTLNGSVITVSSEGFAE